MCSICNKASAENLKYAINGLLLPHEANCG